MAEVLTKPKHVKRLDLDTRKRGFGEGVTSTQMGDRVPIQAEPLGETIQRAEAARLQREKHALEELTFLDPELAQLLDLGSLAEIQKMVDRAKKDGREMSNEELINCLLQNPAYVAQLNKFVKKEQGFFDRAKSFFKERGKQVVKGADTLMGKITGIADRYKALYISGAAVASILGAPVFLSALGVGIGARAYRFLRYENGAKVTGEWLKNFIENPEMRSKMAMNMLNSVGRTFGVKFAVDAGLLVVHETVRGAGKLAGKKVESELLKQSDLVKFVEAKRERGEITESFEELTEQAGQVRVMKRFLQLSEKQKRGKLSVEDEQQLKQVSEKVAQLSPELKQVLFGEQKEGQRELIPVITGQELIKKLFDEKDERFEPYRKAIAKFREVVVKQKQELTGKDRAKDSQGNVYEVRTDEKGNVSACVNAEGMVFKKNDHGQFVDAKGNVAEIVVLKGVKTEAIKTATYLDKEHRKEYLRTVGTLMSHAVDLEGKQRERLVGQVDDLTKKFKDVTISGVTIARDAMSTASVALTGMAAGTAVFIGSQPIDAYDRARKRLKMTAAVETQDVVSKDIARSEKKLKLIKFVQEEDSADQELAQLQEADRNRKLTKEQLQRYAQLQDIVSRKQSEQKKLDKLVSKGTSLLTEQDRAELGKLKEKANTREALGEIRVLQQEIDELRAEKKRIEDVESDSIVKVRDEIEGLRAEIQFVEQDVLARPNDVFIVKKFDHLKKSLAEKERELGIRKEKFWGKEAKTERLKLLQDLRIKSRELKILKDRYDEKTLKEQVVELKRRKDAAGSYDKEYVGDTPIEVAKEFWENEVVPVASEIKHAMKETADKMRGKTKAEAGPAKLVEISGAWMLAFTYIMMGGRELFGEWQEMKLEHGWGSPEDLQKIQHALELQAQKGEQSHENARQLFQAIRERDLDAASHLLGQRVNANAMERWKSILDTPEKMKRVMNLVAVVRDKMLNGGELYAQDKSTNTISNIFIELGKKDSKKAGELRAKFDAIILDIEKKNPGISRQEAEVMSAYQMELITKDQAGQMMTEIQAQKQAELEAQQKAQVEQPKEAPKGKAKPTAEVNVEEPKAKPETPKAEESKVQSPNVEETVVESGKSKAHKAESKAAGGQQIDNVEAPVGQDKKDEAVAFEDRHKLVSEIEHLKGDIEQLSRQKAALDKKVDNFTAQFRDQGIITTVAEKRANYDQQIQDLIQQYVKKGYIRLNPDAPNGYELTNQRYHEYESSLKDLIQQREQLATQNGNDIIYLKEEYKDADTILRRTRDRRNEVAKKLAEAQTSLSKAEVELKYQDEQAVVEQRREAAELKFSEESARVIEANRKAVAEFNTAKADYEAKMAALTKALIGGDASRSKPSGQVNPANLADQPRAFAEAEEVDLRSGPTLKDLHAIEQGTSGGESEVMESAREAGKDMQWKSFLTMNRTKIHAKNVIDYINVLVKRDTGLPPEPGEQVRKGDLIPIHEKYGLQVTEPELDSLKLADGTPLRQATSEQQLKEAFNILARTEYEHRDVLIKGYEARAQAVKSIEYIPKDLRPVVHEVVLYLHNRVGPDAYDRTSKQEVELLFQRMLGWDKDGNLDPRYKDTALFAELGSRIPLSERKAMIEEVMSHAPSRADEYLRLVREAGGMKTVPGTTIPDKEHATVITQEIAVEAILRKVMGGELKKPEEPALAPMPEAEIIHDVERERARQAEADFRDMEPVVDLPIPEKKHTDARITAGILKFNNVGDLDLAIKQTEKNAKGIFPSETNSITVTIPGQGAVEVWNPKDGWNKELLANPGVNSMVIHDAQGREFAFSRDTMVANGVERTIVSFQAIGPNAPMPIELTHVFERNQETGETNNRFFIGRTDKPVEVSFLGADAGLIDKDKVMAELGNWNGDFDSRSFKNFGISILENMVKGKNLDTAQVKLGDWIFTAENTGKREGGAIESFIKIENPQWSLKGDFSMQYHDHKFDLSYGGVKVYGMGVDDQHFAETLKAMDNPSDFANMLDRAWRASGRNSMKMEIDWTKVSDQFDVAGNLDRRDPMWRLNEILKAVAGNTDGRVTKLDFGNILEHNFAAKYGIDGHTRSSIEDAWVKQYGENYQGNGIEIVNGRVVSADPEKYVEFAQANAKDYKIMDSDARHKEQLAMVKDIYKGVYGRDLIKDAKRAGNGLIEARAQAFEQYAEEIWERGEGNHWDIQIGEGDYDETELASIQRQIYSLNYSGGDANTKYTIGLAYEKGQATFTPGKTGDIYAMQGYDIKSTQAAIRQQFGSAGFFKDISVTASVEGGIAETQGNAQYIIQHNGEILFAQEGKGPNGQHAFAVIRLNPKTRLPIGEATFISCGATTGIDKVMLNPRLQARIFGGNAFVEFAGGRLKGGFSKRFGDVEVGGQAFDLKHPLRSLQLYGSAGVRAIPGMGKLLDKTPGVANIVDKFRVGGSVGRKGANVNVQLFGKNVSAGTGTLVDAGEFVGEKIIGKGIGGVADLLVDKMNRGALQSVVENDVFDKGYHGLLDVQTAKDSRELHTMFGDSTWNGKDIQKARELVMRMESRQEEGIDWKRIREQLKTKGVADLPTENNDHIAVRNMLHIEGSVVEVDPRRGRSVGWNVEVGGEKKGTVVVDYAGDGNMKHMEVNVSDVPKDLMMKESGIEQLIPDAKVRSKLGDDFVRDLWVVKQMSSKGGANSERVIEQLSAKIMFEAEGKRKLLGDEAFHHLVESLPAVSDQRQKEIISYLASGGQAERKAITNEEWWVLYKSTNKLNPAGQRHVQSLLEELRKKSSKGMIVIPSGRGGKRFELVSFFQGINKDDDTEER